jgi:hypothetical protein
LDPSFGDGLVAGVFDVGVESGVGGAVAVGELVRVFHQWQEGAVVEVRPEAFA